MQPTSFGGLLSEENTCVSKRFSDFLLFGCRIGCPLKLAGIEITASSAVRVLRCVLRDCEVRLLKKSHHFSNEKKLDV